MKTSKDGLFYKVMTLLFFFFVMGFSYEAFTATDNSRMILNIIFAAYFGIRTSELYQDAWGKKST